MAGETTQFILLPSSLILNNITFADSGRPQYNIQGSGNPTLTLNGNVTVADGPYVFLDSTMQLSLSNAIHTICVSGDTAFRVGSVVNGSGSILKTGGGTLYLDAANGFTGGLEVTNGTLFVGSDTAAGTGTLTLHGDTNFSPSADVTMGNAIVLVGDGALVRNDDDDGSHNMSLTGLITGAGGFDWCTDGTLTLTHASNTFGGGVEMREGTLLVGATDAAGTGTLKLHGDTNFSPSANVTLGNAIVLVGDGDLVRNDDDDGGYNMSLTGLITGCGGFDWCTDGTLTLTHVSNTFSGGVDMREGTLLVGATDAAGSGTLTFDNCTTLGVASGAVGTVVLHNAISFDTDGGKVKIDTSNGDLALLGGITGDGELKKIGSGILTLGGTGDFSGGVTVTAGTLYLANSSLFVDDIEGPVGSDTLKLKNGTTLGVAPSAPPSIGLQNDIALDCAAFTNVNFDTTYGSLTLTGYISGAAGITVMGTHTLTLANDDEYGGGTTINSGATLQLGNGGSSGSITGDVADYGTLIFNRCDDLTFSGSIADSGSLTLMGGVNTRLTLTGTNNLSETNIYAGYLILGDNSSINMTGSITGDVHFYGNIGLGGGELQFNRYDDTTFAGNITGPGRVSSFGNGTTTLAGTNDYSGGTYINSGTIADSTNGNFSPNSAVFINAGAHALFAFNETIAGLDDYNYNSGIGGTAGINAGKTLTISDNGNNNTFTGVISGAGTVAKSGAGTLNLNGANTYTGGTALNAGTLYIGNTSGLGTGTLTAAGGTTFGVGSPLTLANAIALSGGTVNLDLDNSTTLSGAISGSGFLNLLADTSTLTLSNANNSWTGGLIVAGNNSVSLAQNALGSGTLSFSDVASSAIVVISGGAPSIGGLSGSSGETQVSLAPSATLTINQNGTSTYGGEITGVGSSIVKSGTGTLTLTGSSSYTGGTTIAGGTLIYGGNNAFGTGSVTISGGDLNIASGLTLSNPLLFSGAVTLAGNGTIGSLVTAGSGVTLSPGNSPGTLGFSAGLILAGGGALTLQVQDANGPAGTGYDLLSISGGALNITATSGSPFTINLASLNGGGNPGAVSDFNSSSAYTWNFATSSSGITGFNANDFTLNLGSFSNSLNGGTFAVTSDSSTFLALQFTPAAVPEPSTWVMLGMGLVTLPLALRRRRRG